MEQTSTWSRLSDRSSFSPREATKGSYGDKLSVAFRGTIAIVNATQPSVVSELVTAGFRPALLARVAGVNRSSVARWLKGSKPRALARKRLERAVALVQIARISGPGLQEWFTQPQAALTGLSPAQWLLEDRDLQTLAEILQPVDAAPVARRSAESATLATTMVEFSKAANMISSLNLAPILQTIRAMNGLDRQAAMIADLTGAPLLIQASGIASTLARFSETWSEMIRAPLLTYRDAFVALPPTQIAGSFTGMGEILRTLDQPLLRMQTGLIAKLVADRNTGLGALGAAMELQLGGAFAAAIQANNRLLAKPFMREMFAWRAWLPEHPDALVRIPELRAEWLVGQAHVATRASVAAVSRRSDGVDQSEVSAALAGVTTNPPDLLSMRVPGTGESLREIVKSVAPEALEPLEAGWDRVWIGGKDAARQGAASLRAALDEIGNAIAPGPKKDRERSYQAVLQLQPGDPTTRLLTLQVSLLYTTYQPLSDAVHDEGGIEAIQALALGIVSCLAGILARWTHLQTRASP